MMHSVRQLVAWLLLLPPLLQAAPSAQRPAFVQLSAQLNPQYVRAMNAYRRLERSVPRKELRALTTIGLLNGARQAEQQMEEHLVAVIKELLLHTDMQDSVIVLPKIELIEQELVRDQRALDILSSAMDLVTSAKDVQTFRREMREVLQQQQQTEQQAQQQSADLTQAPPLSERLAMLRRHILEQVPNMKTQLDAKIEHTLEHLLDEAGKDGLLAKASHKVLHKRNIIQPEQLQPEEPAEIRMIKSILTEATQIRAQDDFRDNLVVQELENRIEQHKMKQREQESKSEADNVPAGNANEDEFALDFDSGNITGNDSVPTTATTKTTNSTNMPMPAKQEEDSSGELTATDMEQGGGGGLVGIIGSLSGGEGGSDIGALIGALTGLISTLFGPGGLDIEALLGTATSLLAGLLSGNKNFGTVLGTYVGTALDGLSGGGGAINNGQFLGNFLGTVVASLSADPEEEGPVQPIVFAQNLLNSFLEAKNRPPAGDASEERHGSAEVSSRHKKKEAAGAGGSDSGSFVKQIVSHLVSNALGLLLNASLGASGGASSASSGLFASSSAASQHMKPAHHKSWSPEYY